MPYHTIAETLRTHRLLHDLKQADVATKLGMRQSQISTIERGLVSPRLSTVQDIARVLDLELMLIPRQLVAVVSGLVDAERERPTDGRPLYALDSEGDEPSTDDGDPETN
jgi:HTH-type transcriptional regulator / antitoxin HipB